MVLAFSNGGQTNAGTERADSRMAGTTANPYRQHSPTGSISFPHSLH